MTDSTSPTISGSSAARRLVKEDDFGVHRQRAGDGDALLLSAGELARLGVDIRVHADAFGDTSSRFRRSPSRVRWSTFICPVTQLFSTVHVAEQVELLKHHADFGVVARHVDTRRRGCPRRGKGFRPSSGVSSRLMQRSSVDLPEPEEPMMQVTSPLLAAKVHALEHFVVAEGLSQMPLTSITRSIS